MPYTWLMRIPGLSAFREADRFALLGLVGAALLAGSAVDWLRRHAWPLIAVVAALGRARGGLLAAAARRTMPTTLPALDRPDHRRPLRLDRAGRPVRPARRDPRVRQPVPGAGRCCSPPTTATPGRSPTRPGCRPRRASRSRHAFYTVLSAQLAIPMRPVRLSRCCRRPAHRQRGRNQVTPAQLAAARRDVHGLASAGCWSGTAPELRWSPRYLEATGFRLGYRTDGAIVFRPAGTVSAPGRRDGPGRGGARLRRRPRSAETAPLRRRTRLPRRRGACRASAAALASGGWPPPRRAGPRPPGRAPARAGRPTAPPAPRRTVRPGSWPAGSARRSTPGSPT